MKLKKIFQIANINRKLLRESNWTYDLDDTPDDSVNPVDTDSNDKKRKIDSFIKQLQQFGMTVRDIKNGLLRSVEDSDLEPPTDILFDGTKIWLKDGERHRENGPAVEEAYGTKKWYINGELHREDGPAIEYVDGSGKWFKNGKLHRENRPAIERADGTKEWFINDQRHREDGPAYERTDGYKEWWINDRQLSEEEFNYYLKNKSTLSESRKVQQMKQNIKNLLKEGFFSELPKKYINLFSRLLISGQKSNNNFGYKTRGLIEVFNENIFPTIREFYVNLQKNQRLNVFLKTNSMADTLYELNKFSETSKSSSWVSNGKAFIFFHELENPLEYNHIKKQGSRWFSNLDLEDKEDFKSEYDIFDRVEKVKRFSEVLSKFGINSQDLQKITKLSSLTKKKKSNNELSDTLEILLKMPNIPIRIILFHDEKVQDIMAGAAYHPDNKFINEMDIYINLYHININLLTTKSGLNGIFNNLKQKIVSEVRAVLHHEFIHHIQMTSDKKKNSDDVEEHYDSTRKNLLKEPHPFEPDYVNKKKEYDEHYKNLKIKDLSGVSSNLEIKAYIEQIFSKLKNIKRRFKKGDLTQEEYNHLFTKINSYHFQIFKQQAYSFAETHFSKKLELMGQKYDYKTTPNKAYLAVLARFFSVLLNDYNKQNYLQEIITNIKSFNDTDQYIIPLAIERAKTEKHTLKDQNK